MRRARLPLCGSTPLLQRSETMTRTLSPSLSRLLVAGASSADEVDHVSRWLRLVRLKLRRGSGGKPGLHLRVTFDFALLALLATCSGPHPAPHSAIFLFAMMLLHELPGAVWARALGRFVSVSIRSSGGQTEVAGQPLSARGRLALALVGNAAIFATGHALCGLARNLHSPMLAQAGRLYIFWAAVQLLPLLPFKLGSLLRDHVGHRIRVKQAMASFGLAIAVLLKLASHLQTPLVLVAFAIWLYACVRELWDSIARARDEALDADGQLTQIRALTLADDSRRAITLARTLLESARSAELRARAREALAWAAIGASDVALAHDATSPLSTNLLDPHLLASYLTISNRRRHAIALLEEAGQRGYRSSESVRLLADLYFREDDREALAALSDSASDVLTEDELSRIKHALATPARRASDRPTKA